MTDSNNVETSDTVSAMETNSDDKAISLRYAQPSTNQQVNGSMTSADEEHSVQHQAMELKKKLSCSVCGNNCRNAVFVPCYHLACCEDCAKLCESCPICHMFISGMLLIKYADEDRARFKVTEKATPNKFDDLNIANTTQSLKSRAKNVKDRVLCKVCFVNPVQLIFLSCCHTSCRECEMELSNCHICREKITCCQPMHYS